MDWIEHVFGVSPDGGTGSFETLFAVGLFGVVGLVGSAMLRRYRAQRNTR